MDIEFKSIEKSDYKFLYKLLKKRPKVANISHAKMPTWEEHCKFVESKPYAEWQIILLENRRVGSVYITHDKEVGIFLMPKYRGKRIGYKTLKLLFNSLNISFMYELLANIAPKNKASKKLFKKLGFKKIQETYKYEV